MSTTLAHSSSRSTVEERDRRSSVLPPPRLSSVITSPPWAKDEPPSPTDEEIQYTHDVSGSFGATLSPNASNSPSRWWTFTRPRGGSDAGSSIGGSFPSSDPHSMENRKADRKGVSFRPTSISWLPSTVRDGASAVPRRMRQHAHSGSINRDWNLSIALPTPPTATLTLSHNATPGWDTPWTSRVAAQGPARRHTDDSRYEVYEEEDPESEPDKNLRRKRLRAFILTNPYVPLLFRLINITFTTCALAIAIRIRLQETRLKTRGELGSSPTLVIIFAPLTLVHVMVSIYLEYFGRPLGLWRTSAKLAHTLLEVLFICAWSAALSLCFDNLQTSIIPCTSASSIAWYSSIPRPTSTTDPPTGDQRCDDQKALICLVFIGLIAYCVNLVISLYRIFEKLKYHRFAARTSIAGNHS